MAISRALFILPISPPTTLQYLNYPYIELYYIAEKAQGFFKRPMNCVPTSPSVSPSPLKERGRDIEKRDYAPLKLPF